jgi:hypothetical protein
MNPSTAPLTSNYEQDTVGTSPDVHQFFDKDGVRLPHKFGDYYQNGEKPQFCKDRTDKFFNSRGKEVEDDTAFLDVKEIK